MPLRLPSSADSQECTNPPRKRLLWRSVFPPMLVYGYMTHRDFATTSFARHPRYPTGDCVKRPIPQAMSLLIWAAMKGSFDHADKQFVISIPSWDTSILICPCDVQ